MTVLSQYSLCWKFAGQKTSRYLVSIGLKLKVVKMLFQQILSMNQISLLAKYMLKHCFNG